MNAADTDKAVLDYLKSIGVTATTQYGGETVRDGKWECDAWRVQFVRVSTTTAPRKEMSTEFFTGFGHRRRSPGIKLPQPVAPSPASVLYSLLSDARGAESNFYDWCNGYGYDSDSRKALAVYDACCLTLRDIRQFFTPADRDALEVLLEGY